MAVQRSKIKNLNEEIIKYIKVTMQSAEQRPQILLDLEERERDRER